MNILLRKNWKTLLLVQLLLVIHFLFCLNTMFGERFDDYGITFYVPHICPFVSAGPSE